MSSTLSEFFKLFWRKVSLLLQAGMRGHRLASSWLVQCGVPLLIAQLILGVVAVIALLVLLYVVFGLAILLMVIGVLYIVAKNPELLNTDQESKWRDGYDGYGLYRGDIRIDPYSTED